ncbi:MazF family transcriptional regulator [Candidatus Pacearchaeota archaeon]|jgi:mRNA interferase MazF|nr:MazF family transcriptional regulator [Candidatus Pacearchaeota archaeon]|tara:strand:+ start:303 stop:638 length:336 start_codon:yes stop_codon:yes gene_type:complete
MINQRDLLLVPFPFSDQSGRKVRPVVVISNEDFNNHSEDLIVIGITTNISKDKYTLPLNNNELEEGKLFSQCVVKVENILKMDKELIIKKIGKINQAKLENIKEKFSKIIN